jgi:hypothetical protein
MGTGEERGGAFPEKHNVPFLVPLCRSDRFYDWMVPLADRLYDEHLEALEKEGLI